MVYQAEDVRLGRVVALKFLSHELERDPAAIERFQREARAASALNHPHICTVYDVGEHDGRHFIAMELLEGTTLQRLVERGARTTDEVFELGIGRHVRQRSQDRARAGQLPFRRAVARRFAERRSRKPEVQQLCLPPVGHEDVRGLDVAMDDPFRVSGGKGVGQPDAIDVARRAFDRDPLSASRSHTLAVQLALAGRRDEAIEECHRTIGLDPNFAVAHEVLGGLLAGKGLYPEAVSAMQQAVVLSRGAAMSLANLGHVQARAGQEAEARRILQQLSEASKEHYTPALAFAVVHLGLGEHDQALSWLEKAYEEWFNRLAYLRREAMWTPLRPDPRFEALLRRIPQLVHEHHRHHGSSRPAPDERYAVAHGPPAGRRCLERLADQIGNDLPGGLAVRACELLRRLEHVVVDIQCRPHVSSITHHASDLAARLEPLMSQSAENFYNVAQSVRMRYAYALARRGDAARAAAIAAEAEKIARDKMDAGNQTPALRVELAAAAALRRDPDEALAWLGRAFDAGYRDYGSLELDPIFAPLKKDARFVAALERMRRDVAAQRTRAADRGLLDVTSLLTR